jgi:hypothetical protein
VIRIKFLQQLRDQFTFSHNLLLFTNLIEVLENQHQMIYLDHQYYLLWFLRYVSCFSIDRNLLLHV